MSQDRCEYCGQEERYGHNAICVMNTVEELRADNERLRAALHTALEACRAYEGAADTRTWAAAKMWHQEARNAYQQSGDGK